MSHPGSDDNDNGYIYSLTLWGDSSQMKSPLEYDTSISHLKGSQNCYFTDIEIPERERGVQQLFNKTQSRCTKQGIREILAFN